jgi:DNA polymerase-2
MKNAISALRCFLLTHSYRDRRGRFEITLFAKSSSGETIKIAVDNFLPPFFVPRNTPSAATRPAQTRKQLELKDMAGNYVDCVYFATNSDLQTCARSLREAGITPLESDIHPVERYLMERMVRGGMRVEGKIEKKGSLLYLHNPSVRGDEMEPALSVLSLDIETNADTGELYSIALHGTSSIVFMIGNSADSDTITFCSDEKDLLVRFMKYLAKKDPDIIIGWNVIDFDCAMLQSRCDALRMAFDIGREPGSRILPPSDRGGRHAARIPGRVVMDVAAMLRGQSRTFEEYSLDYVASRMLGQHKTIELTGRKKIDEINRLFRDDKIKLAEYNRSDAWLTMEIFDKAGVLPNAIQRSRRSGHLLDRSGGSVAAFDYLYLPLLHRRGYVARDVADISISSAPLAGGYVMESKPGIYENVLLLDFKSLYPTIIMTFCIDPLGSIVADSNRVQGPAGPSFSRDTTILPKIIAELMQARSEAKRTGNNALSYAIKILMNSFYGVLGSSGCRFFSAELASAITGTGQYILRTTCAHIEQHANVPVIYGDTDSLFVLLGEGQQDNAARDAQRIVAQTNTWLSQHIAEKFSAQSALELEFETHFRYFFMPTIRGSSQGSKKRYCGAVEEDGKLSLIFKGLESARSDWTELAKQFQHELLMRVFTGKAFEKYVIALVEEMKRGDHDERLIYRKGVRKRLDEYADHVPPHIQAARMLGDSHLSRIAYAITVDGPQPLEKISAPLDYDHYIDAQIRPIADAILEWKGTSFEAIVSGQQDLFRG